MRNYLNHQEYQSVRQTETPAKHDWKTLRANGKSVVPIRNFIAIFLAVFMLGTLSLPSYAQCSGGPSPTAPLTSDDEASLIPSSRQLTNGVGTAINTSVPNLISINAVLSAQAEITGPTTGVVGDVYPVSTASGAVTFTLPDATASSNSGGAIAVFLKTAGNTLTFDTTASQTMGGAASGGLSTSTANTLFYFVSDGSNWQYWQSPASSGGGGGFGGNGADGAVSITSNSAASTSKILRNPTTYSLSGSSIADSVYSGSTINANSTVTISVTGTGGGLSSTGTGCPGSSNTAQSLYSTGTGVGGGFGCDNTANTGGGGGASAIASGGNSYSAGSHGGQGGTSAGQYRAREGSGGGSGNGNAGGAGGGVVVVDAVGAINMSPASAGTVINVTGAAGADGTSSIKSSAGGGGGGCSFLYSLASITLGSNGTITCAGGDGGTYTGSGGVGGGGGGGGLSFIESPSNTVSGTVTVSGGAAGSGASSHNGTAGSNGVSATVTDTPSLPLISLDLDMRGIAPLVAIEKYKQNSDHINILGRTHNSFLAAFYAAPGKFQDLNLCLNGGMGDVDPRPLCADKFFNAKDRGSPVMQQFCRNKPAVPAEPVCVVDYQVGDTI